MPACLLPFFLLMLVHMCWFISYKKVNKTVEEKLGLGIKD